MTNNPDIRWQQRFSNFRRAFASLAAAVGLARARPLSDLEKQGLIQAFEFTHELAWNVMRDYFMLFEAFLTRMTHLAQDGNS